MRKEPIRVKDSPGFASSRLGLVIGLEAMRMCEAGVASAEDIDKAMTLGYGFPMGPLRLTDLDRHSFFQHPERPEGGELHLATLVLSMKTDLICSYTGSVPLLECP